MFDIELDLPDENDRMSWESYVSAFCESPITETNQTFIDLAHFASFPILLSTDLLYKIYINFIASQNQSKKAFQIWEASEFLFSPIIKELGYDLYEIHPGVRKSLKNKLKVEKSSKYTENIRLAFFMKEYAEKCKSSFQSDQIEKAQILNYEIELDPIKAISEVLKIISESKGKPIGNYAGYLLEYGKSIIGSGENSSLQNQIESTEALLKGIKSQDTIEIEKALKGFDIGTETEGVKITIPSDVKLSILNPTGISIRKVYALLIGINEYQNNPLNGCVNDVLAFEKYLTKYESEPTIIKLLDENATKKTIVEVFETTLSQATSNDVVMFYFAGNGTTTLFSDKNQNIMSDSVVCFNANLNNNDLDDYILSVEEINYLFSHLNSKNNTQIYDCCFTLDTSNKAFLKRKYKDLSERAIIGAAFENSRQSFLFEMKERKKENFNNNNISLFSSDALNNNSSIEVNNNGVFTKCLIEYLYITGGEITYDGLIGRVNQELKVKFDQSPLIKSNLSESELKLTSFLNRPKQGSVGEVRFDSNKNRWCLNLGSIHGVNKSLKLKIIDKNINQAAEISIDNVFSTYCTLNDVNLDREIIYIVVLEGLELRELKIHVKHFNGNLEIVQSIIDKLLEQKDDHFILENDEGDADYTLHIRNEKVYITYPNEIYRPLIEPFELHHPDLNHDLVSSLRHICKYHYIAHMEGDKISLKKNPLGIEVFKLKLDGREEKIDSSSYKVELDFEKNVENWKGYFKIKIKNLTDQNLYVCALYMSRFFSINTDFLLNSVRLLEPNVEVFLQSNELQSIPYSLSPVLKEYNYESGKEIIKFIISNNEFDVKGIKEESLKNPKLVKDKELSGSRGLEETRKSLREELDSINFEEWVCQSLSLEFLNPEYNQISHKALKEMLTFDKMNDFALGIYYDVAKDEYLRPYYKLKEEIELVDVKNQSIYK